MINMIIHGCGGKMGKVLVEAARNSQDFTVVAGVDPLGSTDSEFPVYTSLSEVSEQADVVIDFSVTAGIPGLLDGAVKKKLPLVIATTGLDPEHFTMIEEAARYIPIFQSANMSVGVNLMKVLIKQTTAVLGSSFDIEIVEKHHRTKRDSPSGTALALADVVKSALPQEAEYVYGRRNKNKLRGEGEIGIHAVRGGNIVGEHDVVFAGRDEVITLQHTAYSKGLFAEGALKAAEYIAAKPSGFYQMEHMIAESSTVTNLYTRDEALISFKSIPTSLGTSHNIFEAFSKKGINIDMISQTITDEGFHSLSFSIDNEDSEDAQKVLDDLYGDNNKLHGVLFAGLCKLTVEGIGMETQSGVASSVFGILDEMEVEPKAVTTSETKISVIIDSKDRLSVVGKLKEAYNLK